MEPKASCVLCLRGSETKVTRSLLTEDGITAHHSCLLYASNLFCRDSPDFSDLGGFRVEDVKREVKRGKKLACTLCKKKGATVGCEVGHCKKSYHYPCAMEDGAEHMRGKKEGTYGIYCLKHSRKGNRSESTRRFDPPSSRPRATAGQSLKRTLSPTDTGQEARPAKQNTEDWFPTISDDSLNTEETETNTNMDIYAPLSDVESELSEPDSNALHICSEVVEEAAASPSGGRQEDEIPDETKEEDATNAGSQETDVDSGDSQSLLFSVDVCMDTPSSSIGSEYSELSFMSTPNSVIVPQQELAESVAGDCQRSKSLPLDCQTPDPRSFPMPPPTSAPPRLRTTVPPPSPPPPPPPDREPAVKASSFWKSCNVAGSTKAIFHDFFHEMNGVSERILSGDASDGEYDVALAVVAATGRLAAYVAKQQEELDRKQRELQIASNAMTEVVTAMKKIQSAAGTSAAALPSPQRSDSGYYGNSTAELSFFTANTTPNGELPHEEGAGP
ncbi:unnamed protein product [Ophioblennius macclurei]